jgi:hypothetical protein
MRRSAATIALITALTALAIALPPATAWAADLAGLYTSKAITTGTGEKNRKLGFRDCLDRVLVRVSGDPRLPSKPEMEALRARGGDFVASFSYVDRLAGRPIHDEQGSYDRPHDLTCRYAPEVLDRLLADLGSRPWTKERPVLAVFLDVERYGKRFRVAEDDMRDLAMRQSFAAASDQLAMNVAFPTRATASKLAAADLEAPERLIDAARTAGGAQALSGTMAWSDADLGWVATWHLAHAGRSYSWTIRGVNFDEVFRVGLRGSMQILSGNGAPE